MTILNLRKNVVESIEIKDQMANGNMDGNFRHI